MTKLSTARITWRRMPGWLVKRDARDVEGRYHCLIYQRKVKVKWSRYRPGVAQRGDRGIALLFHDRDTRRGRVVSRNGTHFTGGWVGPRASLDGRKILSSPGFNPAIPTELPGPPFINLSGFMYSIKPRKTSVVITCLKAQKWNWAPSSTQMLLILSQQQIRLCSRRLWNSKLRTNSPKVVFSTG